MPGVRCVRSTPLVLGITLAALTILVASSASAQPAAETRHVAVLTECPHDGADAMVASTLTQAAARGITINTSHVEYETRTCGERAAFVASALTDPGSADGAVIVTRSGDATLLSDGLRIVRLAGLDRVVVLAPEGADTDALRKTLLAEGFDGDHTPIIRGSALRAPACEPDAALVVDALIEAVDTWIPRRRGDVTAPFLMPIDDLVPVRGRGTVATGRIETGAVNVGDEVEILGLDASKLKSTVTGIEMFRKLLDRGEAGDDVSLLLRGVEKKDIRRGMVIAKPGSVTPATRFTAAVYLLKKEEGGRHTPFHNERAAFLIRTADVTGEIELEAGRGSLAAGSDVQLVVTLIAPVAMDKGLRFAIREGGRTVGAGQVTEILE